MAAVAKPADNVLHARAEQLAAERDAAISALGDLIDYVNRVGGFMKHEDQLLLWRAMALREELR